MKSHVIFFPSQDQRHVLEFDSIEAAMGAAVGIWSNVVAAIVTVIGPDGETCWTSGVQINTKAFEVAK